MEPRTPNPLPTYWEPQGLVHGESGFTLRNTACAKCHSRLGIDLIARPPVSPYWQLPIWPCSLLHAATLLPPTDMCKAEGRVFVGSGKLSYDPELLTEDLMHIATHIQVPEKVCFRLLPLSSEGRKNISVKNGAGCWTDGASNRKGQPNGLSVQLKKK